LSDRLEVESVTILRRLLGLDAAGQSSASDFAHNGDAQAGMEGTVRLEQIDEEYHPWQLGALAGVRGETRLARLTDRVLKRTRLAVQGLCSPVDQISSFGTAVANLLTESGLSSVVRCRVIEEGRPRILRALLWDEVYTIGREAIVYAFRHSGAKQIEIEIRYLAAKLRIVVRDDGRGIDPRELRHERNVERGLHGIQQRAERIGAQLRIFSRVGLGTELELSIPGPIAFAQINSGRSSKLGERGADDVVAKVLPSRTTHSNRGGVL
jgi:signal transduction histidine kinase